MTMSESFLSGDRRPRRVRSLHAEVVEVIASWLIGERFRGGDILPNEMEICAELGVSRTVVREAVRTLVAKGMLQVRRKTGTVVLAEDEWSIYDAEVLAWRFRYGASVKFVEDLFRFRAGMETFAAEVCAANPDFDVGFLGKCCDAMEAALHGEGDWFEADLSFHRHLLAGAGNTFLSHLTPILENLFSALLSPEVLIEENMRLTLPRHRDVVTAIAKRDPAEARSAMLRLVAEAREDVLREVADKSGVRK